MSDKLNLKKKKNTTVLSYLVIEPNNFVILPQSLLSPLRYPASHHQPSSTCSNPLACWQCCIGVSEKSQIVRFISLIFCPDTTFLLLLFNPGLFLCHFYFYSIMNPSMRITIKDTMGFYLCQRGKKM